MMNKHLIHLFHRYQKMMWYVGVFGGELSKPLRFLSEFGIVLLLLSDSGIRSSLWLKVFLYSCLLFIALGLGRYFVKLGVVSYNTELVNQENEMLKRIANDCDSLRCNVTSMSERLERMEYDKR